VNKSKDSNVTVKYKIRMVVDVEGEIEGQPSLKDDTGIAPFIQWACDDIEEALENTCECVEVLKVDLEKERFEA
jgi:hypothetical protein